MNGGGGSSCILTFDTISVEKNLGSHLGGKRPWRGKSGRKVREKRKLFERGTEVHDSNFAGHLGVGEKLAEKKWPVKD